MTKIKTKGKQTLNVPATKEGKKFLELLKKFKNNGLKMRSRPRGPRADRTALDSSKEDAKWFAVYLGESDQQGTINWLETKAEEERRKHIQKCDDILLLNHMHSREERQQKLYDWLDNREYGKLIEFFSKFEEEIIKRNL